MVQKTSVAFIAESWVALGAGMGGGRDSATNGILMPDSAVGIGKKAGERIYHRGSHPSYNAMVESKVARLT